MGSSWVVSVAGVSLACQWWGLGWFPSKLAGFQHSHFVVPWGWEGSSSLCRVQLPPWVTCGGSRANPTLLLLWGP